ncbi:Peptidase family M23 [Klenkia soli]|uniref:Peptidase family M23 n=1 Tax=Klenkia soli TaxID=1052260 RepID=A0A1H0I477_9ACTN|nr:M23 family metallopeptidase [Klenkia soli]SDO26206.1 Peptidase family M23 [Klenkia soli]
MTVLRLFLLAVLTGAALTGAAPPAVATPAAPVGLYDWPLTGTPPVTRAFDPPDTVYGPGHRGVDLAGSAGAPVLAAGTGVVAFAGLVAGRPVVSVDHPDGVRTTYEPVQSAVAAGQAVARGTPVGVLLAGHGGCPADACLHWGARVGETYLDPLTLLTPPRVRLLPWS